MTNREVLGQTDLIVFIRKGLNGHRWIPTHCIVSLFTPTHLLTGHCDPLYSFFFRSSLKNVIWTSVLPARTARTTRDVLIAFLLFRVCCWKIERLFNEDKLVLVFYEWSHNLRLRGRLISTDSIFLNSSIVE